METNVLSALDSVTGWNPMGLGSPVGYPSSFLLVPLRAVLASVVGAYAGHLIYFVAVDGLIVFGAARVARVLRASPIVGVALASCALFNPWTYTQVVSGHIFMLLAYGATFWLVAEVAGGVPDERILSLILLAIAPQIQFLVIDSVVYGYLVLRFRMFRAAAVLCLLWFPVLVGIFATHRSLVMIPFTLVWEFGQSIPPLDAALLTGYFAHYDHPMQPIAAIGIGLLLFGGIGGAVASAFRGQRRPAVYTVLFGLIPVLLATGTNGPLAIPFAWLVVHVTEIALFRELYDLLGYAMIGYVCAAALGSAAFRPLSFAPILAAAVLIVAWFAAPPARYFVFDRDLPKTPIASAAQHRFVLLPALYPVATDRGGSGIDPDLRPRSGNATPLNEYAATYPFSSALGWYLEDGSTQRFAALGASAIYSRAWMHTDLAVQGQLPLRVPAWIERNGAASIQGAVMPMLGTSSVPHVAALDANFGSGNVLFGDAAQVRGPNVPPGWSGLPQTVAVRAPNLYVAASKGWIDARLAFVERPEIAQPYGGAYTVNPQSILPITGGMDALVWVRGRLLDDRGGTVALTTDGFAWRGLAAEARGLRCIGECAVAVESHPPENVPLEADPQAISPLAARSYASWLTTALVPAGNTRTLRFDVAYDPLWEAYLGTTPLAHVRIDGTTNGWILPESKRTQQIVIVETGALITALSELIAFLGLVCIFALPTPRLRSI